jgi:hypothetical protein
MDPSSSTCDVVEETPVEAFTEPGMGQGPWFMVDGEDFGISPSSDEDYCSVDIELLHATQRLDRLCRHCSDNTEARILAKIDSIDEEIGRMCEVFENISAGENEESQVGPVDDSFPA